MADLFTDRTQARGNVAYVALQETNARLDTVETDVQAAVDSANGKNKIIYSTSPPGTTANTAGDIWFQRDGSGYLIAQFEGMGGTTWVQRQIADAVIAYLNANKIVTGELSAGVRIIAGPEAGTHAEMTSDGFKVFVDDPVDGVPNEAVRMGTGNDTFGVMDPATGDTLASISQEGVFSGQNINIPNDPTFMGTQLLGSFANFDSPTEQQDVNPGLLDKLPRGIVAFGSMPGGTTYSAIQGIFEVSFKAEQGRCYMLEFPGILTKLATANVAGGYYVRMVNPAHTTDGSAEAPTPTLSNTSLLFYSYLMVGTAAAQASAPARRLILRCNPGGTAVGGDLEAGIVKLLFVAVGSNVAVTPNAGEKMELYVFDVGPDIPYTSRANTSTAAVPQVTQPTIKTYTTVWNASASESFRGDNTARTDTVDLIQGSDPSGYNGNGHAQVIFGGTSVSGETGKTIAQATSGATIKKVEVYLYANSWYYNAGGTALLRASTAASLDSGTPPTASDYTSAITSANWPKPGGRWVNITGASTGLPGGSGAIRSVKIGKGLSGYTYYGRFYGGTDTTKRPKLRITYTK